jgi:tetratricopeptide (TPR) repeat protein
MDGSMPGKTARALCPVCQEPMPPDETECDNCGAFVIDEAVVRLSRAFGIPREKALALFEKGFRHPKQIGDRGVDDVLERGESGLLFLCTNCGGFVATGDLKCPRCGGEFEAEEPEPARKEKDILDMALCPVCGADNDPLWKECEICGEPMGGTEEPPGAVSAAASPTEPPEGKANPEPTVRPEPSVGPQGLDAFDDILEELDEPEAPKSDARVRRIQRLPKVARRPPPAPTRPAPSGRTPTRSPARTRPTPTAAAIKSRRPTPAAVRAAPPPGAPTHKPVARPKAPPPRRPRRITFVSTHSRRDRWAAPPPEFSGGLVIAAAAGLYASVKLGQSSVAWGVAGIVLLLILVILGIALSRREARLGRLDALLLAAGASLGALAPALPTTAAPALSAAGALLLAFATRRLMTSAGRDFVVAASGVSLVALGVVAAEGLPFATHTAWLLGLAAAVPWPAAVAIQGLRQRHTSAAAHREIVRAEEDLARKDYAESVRDFDRAIALGPKGTPGEELPWYGKGASLILLGRYEEALRAIDKALDLNPHNEVAWLNKGNALTKLGRLIDALRCFNAAIKVNPAYEVAWNNKGNTLSRLEHHEEALSCYERALEIDPEYRGAWVNKGYVLTKLGRYDEATSCADRALRLNERSNSRAA